MHEVEYFSGDMEDIRSYFDACHDRADAYAASGKWATEDAASGV